MNYAKILKDDLTNGEGYRVSVWTTGCPHKCKGCHNPHLFDKNVGKKFTNRELVKILLELDILIK